MSSIESSFNPVILIGCEQLCATTGSKNNAKVKGECVKVKQRGCQLHYPSQHLTAVLEYIRFMSSWLPSKIKIHNNDLYYSIDFLCCKIIRWRFEYGNDRPAMHDISVLISIINKRVA